MKKRLLAIVLCMAMALSLCACGAKKDPVVKYQKQIRYDSITGEEMYVLEQEYDERGRVISYKQTYGEDYYYNSNTEYEVEWEDDGNTAVGTYDYKDENEGLETYIEEEYDKKGNVIESKTYTDDVLTSKTEKEYKGGKIVESKMTTYLGGEPWQVQKQEYNENGDVVKVEIKQNGQFYYGYEIEYEYDKDGNILEQVVTIEQNGEKTKQKVEIEYDKNGHMESAEYNDGLYEEYECDDDGNIIESKSYTADGMLISEIIREYYED